jgi:DNA-binding NarL/FixJ family response regulator
MAGLKTRVLIADDFAPLRRFVCSLLEKQPELQVVDEAADGPEALWKSEKLQPEIVVLDINLPGPNGFEVARQLQKLLPQSKIILCSEDRSFDTAEHALRTCADAYVVKSNVRKELLPAIEAVLRGEKYVSSSLVGRPHPDAT